MYSRAFGIFAQTATGATARKSLTRIASVLSTTYGAIDGTSTYLNDYMHKHMGVDYMDPTTGEVYPATPNKMDILVSTVGYGVFGHFGGKYIGNKLGQAVQSAALKLSR